jgi:hypothetical protein
MPDSTRPNLSDHYSPEEVAALFSISLRMVHSMCRSSKLKARKVRGQWWIPCAEIERFRRQSERAS